MASKNDDPPRAQKYFYAFQNMVIFLNNLWQNLSLWNESLMHVLEVFLIILLQKTGSVL